MEHPIEQGTVKSISVKTIIAISLFVLAVVFFGLLARFIVIDQKDWFDTRAFEFFKSHSTPTMIDIFHFLTFFGSSNFLFAAYILLIFWLFFKKRRNDGIDILIVGVTSTLLMFGLKNIFRRHRPDLPLFKELSSYSFPSGHAMSSFVFCSVLVWLTWQMNWKTSWKWVVTVLLLFFSISIGISRIVLRYHYASDVVAGFSLGFAWVLLSLWAQQKFRPKSIS